MWKRITNPDVLIYLDVSYPVTLARRAFDWREQDYHEQVSRLLHARQHADLVIETDALNPAEVLTRVLDFIGTE
jgi:cytidylate kinase